jgi:hypothetical protein
MVMVFKAHRTTLEVIVTPYVQITVECYSGYKANERPAAFTMQTRRREVAGIVDRWYEGGLEPGHPEEKCVKNSA